MQQDNGNDKSTNHCLDKCDSPTQTNEMQASSIDFSGFINSEQVSLHDSIKIERIHFNNVC